MSAFKDFDKDVHMVSSKENDVRSCKTWGPFLSKKNIIENKTRNRINLNKSDEPPKIPFRKRTQRDVRIEERTVIKQSLKMKCFKFIWPIVTQIEYEEEDDDEGEEDLSKGRVAFYDVSPLPTIEFIVDEEYVQKDSEVKLLLLQALVYEEIQEIKKHEDKFSIHIGFVIKKVADKMIYRLKKDFNSLENYFEKSKSKTGVIYHLGCREKTQTVSSSFVIKELDLWNPDAQVQTILSLCRRINKEIGHEKIVLRCKVTKLCFKMKKINNFWIDLSIKGELLWERFIVDGTANGVWKQVSSW